MPYDKNNPISRERNREYQHRWYLANKEKQNQRAAIQKKKNRQRNFAIVRKRLETGCVDCGESDIIVLEFDHVRGEKKYNIGTILARVLGIETLENELAKCEVRCRNCHTRRTAKSQNWWKTL